MTDGCEMYWQAAKRTYLIFFFFFNYEYKLKTPQDNSWLSFLRVGISWENIKIKCDE